MRRAGDTARLWLTVAEGGKWTVAEIDQELRAGHRTLQRRLEQMSNAGMLTEYQTEPPTWGVTPECTVPRDVTLAEILRAVGVSR